MDTLFHYKGYRYYITEAHCMIFDKRGLVVKSEDLKVTDGHKIVHNIIDGFKEKEIKRHITLNEVADNTFDVYAESLYLGWFKFLGNDTYECRKEGDLYHAYIAKGIHSMMEYYRGVEEEKKEEK